MDVVAAAANELVVLGVDRSRLRIRRCEESFLDIMCSLGSRLLINSLFPFCSLHRTFCGNEMANKGGTGRRLRPKLTRSCRISLTGVYCPPFSFSNSVIQ